MRKLHVSWILILIFFGKVFAYDVNPGFNLWVLNHTDRSFRIDAKTEVIDRPMFYATLGPNSMIRTNLGFWTIGYGIKSIVVSDFELRHTFCNPTRSGIYSNNIVVLHIFKNAEGQYYCKHLDLQKEVTPFVVATNKTIATEMEATVWTMFSIFPCRTDKILAPNQSFIINDFLCGIVGMNPHSVVFTDRQRRTSYQTNISLRDTVGGPFRRVSVTFWHPGGVDVRYFKFDTTGVESIEP